MAGCSQLLLKVGWWMRWPVHSRAPSVQKVKTDVLERLTWGGCRILDPKVLLLYHLCPYLLGNHEGRQRGGHQCQQASEGSSDPEGANRAVTGACMMHAGFIIHSETFVFVSLIEVLLTQLHYEYKMQTTELSQTRETWLSGKGVSPCWRRREITLNSDTPQHFS